MARTNRPADYNVKNIWEGCGKCSETGSVSWGMDVSGSVTLMEGGRIVAQREVNKVCFDCDGLGGKRVSQAQIDRREKDRARREAKRTEKLAAATQAREAFKAEHPDVFAWMDGDTNSFSNSLMESFLANTLNGRPALSDKQLAAAKASIAKDAERAAQREAERANASPVVEGRQEITGKVVSVKAKEDPYSYSGGIVWKMTVKDDRGFKVWGTVPSTIDPEQGDRVTFTATVSASKDDNAFGFFKRPTKAAMIDG